MTPGLPAPPDESTPDSSSEALALSDATLARYTQRIKGSRIRYFSIVAVIMVALGVFAAVVWSRGEAAHVTLHIATHAAPRLPLQLPSTRQQRAWSTSDHMAIGYPVHGGTVVTYSQHTVSGRNARTGATTWSYDRSDRKVCTAVQLGGATMAIYAVSGNCDEVSTFDTGTGKRRWTRTLDEDGMPLNGRPAYAWTGATLMMTTSTVVYALDPSTGLDRWTYTRNGCRINSAVLGTAGALISQTCTSPRCKNVAHCGRGPQLLLRDGTNGKGDDSKPNADRIIWNDIGNSDVPAAAGAVVAGLNRTTRQLDRYRSSNGKPSGTTTLSPQPVSVGKVSFTDTDSAALIQLEGRLYAIDAAAMPLWTIMSSSRPTLDQGDDGRTPTLQSVRISTIDSTGVSIVDGNSGKQTAVKLPIAPASGDLGYAAGTGYLVASASQVVAYR